MVHDKERRFALALLIVLELTTVGYSQVRTWNHRGPSAYQPHFEYHDPDSLKFAKSTSNAPYYGNSLPYQTPKTVYGPQPNRECLMRYDLLDPRNIADLDRELNSCGGKYISCHDAANQKYRRLDSTCNNLKNPMWGAAGACLKRILPYDYADKILMPRESCGPKPLPSPRLVSSVFHEEVILYKDDLTTTFMEWGQLLAHDVSHNDVFKTPESNFNAAVNCCLSGPTVDETCISMAVPPNDPFYGKEGVTCLSYVRTMPCPGCTEGQRHHWNLNTAFHDLSLIYGNTDKDSRKLRSGRLGMFEIEYNTKSGPMPPTVAVEEFCISPPRQKGCYKTGDARANQNPFLLTVHIIMLRNHNFNCQELSEVNPHWDDDKLFEEARRINIAQAQFITYGSYLPFVLGDALPEKNIQILEGAKYTTYDPTLDPGLADEYTTVAARYGHSLVPGTFTEVDLKTGKKSTSQLRNFFYTPFGFRYGQFDRIVQGMTQDKKMKHDVFVTSDLRNFLYRRTYLNETTGIDLTAGAVNRGRDHGVPGYTYYVKHLLNITISSFKDLRKIITGKSVDLLETLFGSVHDVDLYSAALAEYYVPGGFVGPTFSAILSEQYRRMKFGDRYWFEHGGQAGSFTPDQLLEIKRTTLSRILCETTAIKEVQGIVYQVPSHSNPVVPCETLHKFDFSFWKERRYEKY